MLLNNMSEAFDSVIVDARAKHIYTMLKDIRLYLLNRQATNREKIALFEGFVLPKINKRLQKESTYSNMWVPR